MSSKSNPVLYIVATPIGNLDDLSPHAKKVLEVVDVVAAEDTRNAKKLLHHLNITKAEIVSYYDHVESSKAVQIIERMVQEKLSLALISDAGTPCIADPGYRLVKEAHRRDVMVVPIPGPSSPITLASASGLPSDRILFIGFFPAKKSQASEELKLWKECGASVIFLESTRRIIGSLKLIQEHYPLAEVAIGREMTKIYEEVKLMPIKTAIAWLEGHNTLKGEVTVMISGFTNPDVEAKESEVMESEIYRKAIKGFKEGATLKDMLTLFRDEGLTRAELYQLLLRAKEKV